MRYKSNKQVFIKQILLTLYTACLFLCACTGDDKSLQAEEKHQAEQTEEQKTDYKGEPIVFDDIVGEWQLFYPNDLGYEFLFYKNYRALIIIYAGNHALLFKGVYTIEESNTVRININEMKRSQTVRGFSRTGGFTQIKSSYFLLHCLQQGRGKAKSEHRLIVRPVRLVIDGNNSDGYLEPILRLKRR